MIGKKFTKEQVVSALEATGGFITHAANILGCNYRTIENYMKRDPSLVEIIAHIRENRLDIAEGVVVTTMESDDAREAMGAAKFYLKYKGRKRGYVKTTKVEVSEDLSKMMEAAEERIK